MPTGRVTRRNTFTADIREWSAVVQLRIDILLRVIALQIYVYALQLSPVDSGRFRANWRLSLRRPNLKLFPKARASGRKHKAPPNKNENSHGQSALRRFELGFDIYLSNNLPYAVRLENGWSPQAPGTGAVMRRAIFRSLRDIRRQVAQVKASVRRSNQDLDPETYIEGGGG